MRPKITMDEWQAAVDSINLPDVIPDGWLTFTELMERFGLGDTQTKGRIKALVMAGLAERRCFRVRGGDFRNIQMPHWHLTQKTQCPPKSNSK